MRQAEKPASMNELMGEKNEGKAENDFCLADLPELLGEKMPELPTNRVGRYRLTQALKLRFGPGFKNIPGIKNILSEFDAKIADENVIRMNMKGRQNG